MSKTTVAQLEEIVAKQAARIDALEARLAELEAAPTSTRKAAPAPAMGTGPDAVRAMHAACKARAIAPAAAIQAFCKAHPQYKSANPGAVAQWLNREGEFALPASEIKLVRDAGFPNRAAALAACPIENATVKQFHLWLQSVAK